MRIALVEDIRDMRMAISQWIKLAGYEVDAYESTDEALRELTPSYNGIAMVDVRMPEGMMDGMALLRKLVGMDKSLPVIMITGHGDIPMAVEAMRIGAYDFLTKPLDHDRMPDLFKRATAARKLALENRALRKELSDPEALGRRLVGSSPAMKALRETILDYSQADGNIMILGETGTGKSLVARALHACGPRANHGFASASCAGLEPGELEGKLFGPAGEGEDPPLVEQASGGTLCLEDIESLPDSLQARLLDLLAEQEKEGQDGMKVISICNQAKTAKECGKSLRKDLFFRLSALQIEVPSLRSRSEDVLDLFGRFMERLADEYGCETPEITAEDATLMLQFEWPGNVRQLMSLAERAALQGRQGGKSISKLLNPRGAGAPAGGDSHGKPLKEYVEAFEKMLIDSTMRRNHGSITAVMDELKLPRRTLNEKMAKYKLSRSSYL